MLTRQIYTWNGYKQQIVCVSIIRLCYISHYLQDFPLDAHVDISMDELLNKLIISWSTTAVCALHFKVSKNFFVWPTV